MAKSKSSVTASNIKNIRVCNMSFVPMNQLEKIAKDGCYIPVLKQGVSSDAPHLTDKENECLQHFVDGHNVKAIAQLMVVSERRICLILEALRRKFAVNTDHWLVSKYYQLGMDASSKE